MKKYKKRLGDRYDGRYLWGIDPFYKIIPYIMKTRVDSQVYFEDKINIDNTSAFIKDMRKNEKIKVGYLYVIIAAIVRTIALKPRLNRFVSGRRIYARNEISVSLAIKKAMNENTPETTIKVSFDPNDTLYDVVRKVDSAINSNKDVDAKNDTDKVAKAIMYCPGFIIRFLISLLNFLDHHGKLPKFINRVSPFHSSLCITDLGSLGIEPVYHHIYEFGTTSLFLAFGSKNKERSINKDGEIEEKRYINMKAVVDERICDGFYYARAFKVFKKLVENPKLLTVPPKKVYEDNEI